MPWLTSDPAEHVEKQGVSGTRKAMQDIEAESFAGRESVREIKELQNLI